MEMKKVLKYAMEIGECMLVSGAGVSRVEDNLPVCRCFRRTAASIYSDSRAD